MNNKKYNYLYSFRWLSKRINNKNTGAYSFQNAFFYLQLANDEIVYRNDLPNTQLRAALVTQKKTRRSESEKLDSFYFLDFKNRNFLNFYFHYRRQKLHPQKQRSKFICKPEAVLEAGNHFVWEFCSGKGGINVPSNSAILHRKYFLIRIFVSLNSCFKMLCIHYFHRLSCL